MKQNFWVIAAFVLTFAAGVLTGAIVVRQFGPPPPVGPGMMRLRPEMHAFPNLQELQRRMNLSAAQREQIAAIFAKYQGQIQEHLQQVRPPMHKLMRQMRSEIEQVLTPEQREQFQRMGAPPPRRLPRQRNWPPPDSEPAMPPGPAALPPMEPE
ncbi:MAG: hypothetical protein ONB48_09060 [candidate division KSB1 bacterium]|nr:hypothetical protein [candidate division KSB1 bacterium]MDZ7275922.1 hypothetical protein [candidate division KSB1 bacterium]MDZ7285796.1 hypothetical protein [candidate division KSB1 bacterium]MDZ7298828.1 hypothetical protein [candidate division KSB1 bacterium]MDZ7309000.1 hypothetical protein [candidate division KSB1 bacterium]